MQLQLYQSVNALLIKSVCFYYQAQINHNKKVQEDAAMLSLRQTNLDPGINLLFGKMRDELHQTKSKLEQAQSELSAWKFTPDRFVLGMLLKRH